MKTLDLAFIKDYFESEVQRLTKVAEKEEASQKKNVALLALYQEHGYRRGDFQQLQSKLAHSKIALESVKPRIEKLQEQLTILG